MKTGHHTSVPMSLKDFLKKYSTIPNAFIDDLFALYGQSTQQSDHVVHLDAAAKWLKIRKDHMVNTLRESYKKNSDYTVIRQPKQTGVQGWGGHNKVYILLTPDCFKRLCMRSRGKMAEDVRTYFIELEGLVLKYKDHMMAGMQAEIDRLERGDARHASNKKQPGNVPVGGYLYVVRASERMSNIFKIGRSKNLRRRLREHQSSRADDLEVMFVFRTENVEAVEACTHGTLLKRKKKTFHEIFECDIDVIKAVVRGCERMQDSILKLEYKAKGPGVLTGGCYMCAMRDVI